MVFYLRCIVTALLLTGSFAPAAVSLCSSSPDHCRMASAHACCKTPRLIACECGDPLDAHPAAEPAAARVSSAPLLVPVPHFAQVNSIGAGTSDLSIPQGSPPLRTCGDRLTLLSVQIV